MKILAGILLACGLSSAQEAVLEMDAAQTEIHWSVDSALHKVHGTFHMKRGVLRLNSATGQASGEFVVDVSSGESGSSARDKRMQKEVLESQKYPEAVFQADRIDGKIAPEGESKVAVHGMFRIHGADHELVMEAVVKKSGDQYTATAHFTIPYVKWGMKDPSNFLLKVNPDVEMEIKTSARGKSPTSQASADRATR